jgi:hypothetical protein
MSASQKDIKNGSGESLTKVLRSGGDPPPIYIHIHSLGVIL